MADIETTVVFDVMLDLAEAIEPAIGRMIGLDTAVEPRLNRLFLRKGRLLEAGRRHEALVSEAFAKARQLKPGDRLMGEDRAISAIAVTIDSSQARDFYRQLKAMPKVATVSIKAVALKTFQETSARNVLFFTTIVTVLAAAMTVGVVYNSARIALAERGWELASLRVIGCTRHEVSVLLLGELALVNLTHSEEFYLPAVIQPRTYAYASGTTVAAGVVSALIVRHRIDHLNLVAVLKTRES